MKKIISIFAVLAILFASQGCNIIDHHPAYIEEEEGGDEGPMTGFDIIINEDGSVLVEGDDGVKRVNSLTKAITDYADKNVVTTEGKKTVPCNNVFILPRGACYYIDTKYTVTTSVTIKAAEGNGARPKIQRLKDVTGTSPSDLLILNKNMTMESIHVSLEDAADGLMTGSTGIRLKKAGITFSAVDCLFECVEKAFVRCDASKNKILFIDCTIRNAGNVAGVNEGRVVDTRGNDQEMIDFENCYIYNIQGDIIRDGNAAAINNIIFRYNTMINIGTRLDFVKPRNMEIVNNIMGNFGWKSEAQAATDNYLYKGENINVRSFYVMMGVDDAAFDKIASITITNNNVFETGEMMALFHKYPESAHVEGLDQNGEKLIALGKLTYQDNISEILKFDNPCPVSYDWIEAYFQYPGGDKQPEVYEKFKMFYTDKEYTYNYPSTYDSATASTAGGMIGASL